MVRAVNELFSVAHVPFRRHMSRKKKRRPEQQIRILCEGGICFKTRRRRVFFVKKINNGEITETQYMRVQFQNYIAKYYKKCCKISQRLAITIIVISQHIGHLKKNHLAE
eukprot:GEMP01104370.1.p1 GENE.GEMP01104370.1~~GEMP01104370.1.p1  ORF type:complete len:110 (+),score=4.25 GEMP01104370.1:283-612(+)